MGTMMCFIFDSWELTREFPGSNAGELGLALPSAPQPVGEKRMASPVCYLLIT